jgi:hypothetical protein
MRKQPVVLAAVCTVLALTGGVAWAANAVVVNVPFAFVVDGHATMPAGRYEIKADNPDEAPVTIRNLDTRQEHAMMPLTRVAQVGTPEGLVVFDKTADGTCYLSEVHIPGIDGFIFQGATARHTHVKVTGKP